MNRTTATALWIGMSLIACSSKDSSAPQELPCPEMMSELRAALRDNPTDNVAHSEDLLSQELTPSEVKHLVRDIDWMTLSAPGLLADPVIMKALTAAGSQQWDYASDCDARTLASQSRSSQKPWMAGTLAPQGSPDSTTDFTCGDAAARALEYIREAIRLEINVATVTCEVGAGPLGHDPAEHPLAGPPICGAIVLTIYRIVAKLTADANAIVTKCGDNGGAAGKDGGADAPPATCSDAWVMCAPADAESKAAEAAQKVTECGKTDSFCNCWTKYMDPLLQVQRDCFAKEPSVGALPAPTEKVAECSTVTGCRDYMDCYNESIRKQACP